MGPTLAHEHLFVLSQEFQHNYPFLWDRERGVAEAAAQLERAYDAGLRTVVDMTVIGQGRDIELVRAVADRTRMNIVVATGVYTIDGIPPFARFRGPGCLVEAPDPLIDLLTADITDGIAGSGIRAGVVKFACERTPPDDSARRMASAVAEVHRRTGVAVVVHCDPFEGNGLELVALLTGEGVASDRVVVAHAGDSGDLDTLRALADTGCLLGFDRYGMTALAPDDQRNRMLAALVRAGHGHQILVSQDHASHIDYLTTEQRRELFPDWSYTHLVERVFPQLLREPGVDESTLTMLLEDNPRRLLTAGRVPAPLEVGA
ncbi:phosphotriesterase [Krasilnikovia sp. MM14-A1259]|uniref:phosphotriesterase family protein n=1 Tax=Krasilnikovia sp. MM14-A1259 TaxID=3373539 RepID=UPI00399D1352